MRNVTVTFFHKEPTSEDFVLTNSGALILKRRLNFNVVQEYNFNVTAKVGENIYTQHLLMEWTDVLTLRTLQRLGITTKFFFVSFVNHIIVVNLNE